MLFSGRVALLYMAARGHMSRAAGGEFENRNEGKNYPLVIDTDAAQLLFDFAGSPCYNVFCGGKPGGG